MDLGIWYRDVLVGTSRALIRAKFDEEEKHIVATMVNAPLVIMDSNSPFFVDSLQLPLVSVFINGTLTLPSKMIAIETFHIFNGMRAIRFTSFTHLMLLISL